jgi:hypothetical protein
MSTTLKQTQAISKIADVLYRFLPGSPYPYAAKDISFPGVAKKLGISNFWTGGSKKPAIIQLLQRTLESRRDKFCDLIVEIIKSGIVYLSNKVEPVTREEIDKLNQLIIEVDFKIPDLWDATFLNSLPSSYPTQKTEKIRTNTETVERLKNELINLVNLKPQERGFTFEKFLNGLFKKYNLDPRGSFRIVGEQIDGSFQLANDIYLIEAKWCDKQTDQSDLLIFREKVESKSTWGRGLFISYSGFTKDGLTAYSKGRATNIIGMDCQDLFYILEGEISLTDAIIKKVRRAAETGAFYVSVFSLLNGD